MFFLRLLPTTYNAQPTAVLTAREAELAAEGDWSAYAGWLLSSSLGFLTSILSLLTSDPPQALFERLHSLEVFSHLFRV